MLKRHLLFLLTLTTLILSHAAIAQANDSVLNFVPAGERATERYQEQQSEQQSEQQLEQQSEQQAIESVASVASVAIANDVPRESPATQPTSLSMSQNTSLPEHESIASSGRSAVSASASALPTLAVASPAPSVTNNASTSDIVSPVTASVTTTSPSVADSSADSSTLASEDNSSSRSGRLSFQPTNPLDNTAAKPSGSGAQSPTESIAATSTTASQSDSASSSAASSPSPTLDSIFKGDAHSLVAKAVGSAEGTRTPKGDRTKAYYGHVDPGNQVWNLGSFSYQHEASSPEDADRRQLNRLRRQADFIQAKAAAYQIQLSLEELLNGIDLANQAPKAALDRDSYVDWLAKARQAGKQGFDGILWARTYAFLNPVTRQWDAPGLGNNKESIRRDQQRRMVAIADAIAMNPQSRPSSMMAAFIQPFSQTFSNSAISNSAISNSAISNSAISNSAIDSAPSSPASNHQNIAQQVTNQLTQQVRSIFELVAQVGNS